MADQDEAYDAAIAKAGKAYETAIGGPEAAIKAKAVMEALHAFAQASPAAWGRDVRLWFIERDDAATEAHSAVMRTHFAERRKADSESDPQP